MKTEKWSRDGTACAATDSRTCNNTIIVTVILELWLYTKCILSLVCFERLLKYAKLPQACMPPRNTGSPL